ncbi:GNAT family N-acetyltransferase [Scleromatobacter humisilvae]|uniref:GNAT family N-acetyltransferase n=1 Tax=Scleromatobacter humisilvae TaxID=2897159 RepID=A0A9X2C035_9BURK|nr:GNAT family N-acetyltransferase [Scleromatobacter humisilvae]MCK9686086.1 GNAT family N-acetyltransferase [Scleromatobacter humisilvae]
MSSWQLNRVPLKFQLGDLTLFSVALSMQTRSDRLSDETRAVESPARPGDPLERGSQGFMIRALPVAGELPTLRAIDGFLRYVPLQYRHCYIDLRTSFDEYQNKFSSKTRATIKRKLRKYAEHCGGQIDWKTFASPAEMRDFHRHAREVSRKTYQEKLLDAGIPDTQEFMSEMESLAAAGQVRGYVLFDRERAVSYLYCPVHFGTLVYAYLGYDPAYMQHSVGTVLQWLAVQQMFEESIFKFFDFTEGQSDHKRLFATHELRCANVIFVRRTLPNIILLRSHWWMGRFSKWLGDSLQALGLKDWIKRRLRFGGAQ